MDELDKEAILKNNNKNKDISATEKINTISIKSTVNPEKDIALTKRSISRIPT